MPPADGPKSEKLFELSESIDNTKMHNIFTKQSPMLIRRGVIKVFLFYDHKKIISHMSPFQMKL